MRWSATSLWMGDRGMSVPVHDPEAEALALAYVGPRGPLRRGSLRDGFLDVLAPFGPGPRPMRLRPGASERCWSDQVGMLARVPADPGEARSRLDRMERGMEAVRRAEWRALRTCVAWRTAGAAIVVCWMMGNLVASGILVRLGHDGAAIACAALVSLPHVALTCATVAGLARRPGP